MVGAAKRIVPQPQFVVLSEGALQGLTFVVAQEEATIGRRSVSGIHLDDPHVSRDHALVRRQSGITVIEDLGSTGGTFVNGEAVVGTQALRHNDEVRLGTVVCRFEDRGSFNDEGDKTEAIPVQTERKPVLSPRQQEVLGFLKEGLTNPEIAKKLGVTERTVKAHCQEVFDRLGARNRTAAVASAMQMGMFEPR